MGREVESIDPKAILWDIIGRTGNSAAYIEEARRTRKLQKQLPNTTPFPCNVSLGRSSRRPTNIRMLRPGDIDVTGCIGDSLLAGNGALATDVQHVLIENRGVAIANGGQGTWNTYLTLPNIIKEFNPNLVGYSYGDSTTLERDSQFNVAEPTATSKYAPFMAKELVKRIRNDRRVDLKNHWKLISFLFGANDICQDVCMLDNPYEAVELHRRKLFEAFTYLKHNLPRTIINLIIMPDLTGMVNSKPLPEICHVTRYVECPCLFREVFKNYTRTYFDIMTKIQKVQEEFGKDPRFKDTDDFAIIAQPHVRKVTLPTTRNPVTHEIKTDLSFYSADCFHLSQKTIAECVNGLWNNLLQPAGKKTVGFFPLYKPILCPTKENPFIRI